MRNLLKNKLLWISLLIFTMLSTCCIASDVATTNSTVDGSTTDEESALFVASDLYLFDTDITVDQIVDGNAFIFGTNVTISGEIGGDVFVLADNVTFTNTSYVHGNIFACANVMKMDGLAYDLYAVSENFELNSNSIIARDVKILASNMLIEGKVKRDAYITTNGLAFAEDAKNLITGNLYYSSEAEFSISEDVVNGSIKYTALDNETSIGETIMSYINTVFSALLYSLAVVLLAVWLAPKFVDKTGILLKEKAPQSFGLGLLASIILVVVSIIILIATSGLGLSVFAALIAIFVLALTIAKTIFSIGLVKLFANKFKLEKKFQIVLLSLFAVFVITLLELIPFVGGIIEFIVCMTGFGMVVFNLVIKKEIIDSTSEI